MENHTKEIWQGALRPIIECRRQIEGKDTRPYLCLEDMILRDGTEFKVHPKQSNQLPKMQDKRCFYNATDLVMRNPDLFDYVEGYALIPEINLAFLHAWVCPKKQLSNPIAIETTWDEPGVAYRGVRFTSGELAQIVGRTGVYGVLEDWQNQYPCLSIDKINGAKLGEWYFKNK